MKRLAFLAIGMMFVAQTARAEMPVSAFFTPDEMAKLALPDEKQPAATREDIHLGAVFYYGPDDWSLWLNNARWTPATQNPDVQIVEVQPGRVKLTATGLAQVISLKPFQTFRASTGKVVEGSP